MRFEDLFEPYDHDDNSGACGKCLYCRMRDLMEDDGDRTLRVDLTFDTIAVLVASLGMSMSLSNPPPGAVYEMKGLLKTLEQAFEQQYVGL